MTAPFSGEAFESNPVDQQTDRLASYAAWRAAGHTRHAHSHALHAARGTVFGMLLILVGGIALLSQVVPGFNADLAWSLALIVLGALTLVGALSH